MVVLHEVRAAHVRGLLSFMYRGQVNLTPDQMPEFLRAAQALHVKGLFEDLQQHKLATDKENTVRDGAAVMLSGCFTLVLIRADYCGIWAPFIAGSISHECYIHAFPAYVLK